MGQLAAAVAHSAKAVAYAGYECGVDVPFVLIALTHRASSKGHSHSSSGYEFNDPPKFVAKHDDDLRNVFTAASLDESPHQSPYVKVAELPGASSHRTLGLGWLKRRVRQFREGCCPP